jgi:O-antigen/teichoic acid export membrane protein
MPLLAVRIIALPLNLLALGVAARVLDPAAFGKLAVLIAAIGIGTVVYAFGLPRNLLRDIGEMRARAEQQGAADGAGDAIAKVMTQLLFFFGLLLLGTAALGALLAPMLGDVSRWEVFLYGTAGLLNAFAMCLSEILRALNRFWSGAFLSTVGMLAVLSIVIMALAMGGVTNIFVYAALATASFALCIAGGVIVLRMVLRRSLLHRFTWREIGTLLLISVPVFGMDLVTLATNQLDIVIVSAAYGLVDAGEYSMAVRISALLGLFKTILAAKVSPSIIDFRARSDNAGASRHAQRWSTLIFLAALPAALVMMFFGKPVGGLIFGNFSALALILLQALVCAQIVNLLVGPASELLIMHGHRWSVFVIVSAATGCGLLMMLLMAFVFDATLVSFAWTVAATIAITQFGYAAGLYIKEGYWSGVNLTAFKKIRLA